MADTEEKTLPEQNDTPDEKTEDNTPKKRRSPMNHPQLFLLHALIIVVAIWLLFGLFFGVTTAPNNDMYPRIDTGDLLLYYRLDKDVKAQDVVVIRKNDTTYVARVVAVAGDTVEITDDERLVINGNSVIESNIFRSTPRYEGFVNYPLTLEEGTFFVLVDARNTGEDSRYFGPVSTDELLGTVITVVRRTNL